VLARGTPLRYGTFELAKLAGVSSKTIYRWLGEGRLPEPFRDVNGRRQFTPDVVALAMRLGVEAARFRRNTGRRLAPAGG
jgi:DNA-binding transcriptional MerR regulator